MKLDVARRYLLGGMILPLVIAASPALGRRTHARNRHVKIGDDYFVHTAIGAVVKARRGDTVTFDWTGHDPHHVKAVAGPAPLESPTKSGGSWFQRVKKPGTYSIVCTIHGAAVMSMTLKVRQ